MQYNETTNKSGILQECERWVFGGDYGAITNSTNRLATFTSHSNLAVSEIITEILKVDERFQFDDGNYTDLPIATRTLSDGQQDYGFDVTQIKITGIDVLGADGVYYPLTAVDIHDIRKYGKGKALTEYKGTDGKPLEYDVSSNSIFLYPAPATGFVTMAKGMKLYYQRDGVAFETTDTSVVPGIPSLFHELVAVKASNRYAKQNSMTEKARELDAIEFKLLENLREWYSNRHTEEEPRLVPMVENNR